MNGAPEICSSWPTFSSSVICESSASIFFSVTGFTRDGFTTCVSARSKLRVATNNATAAIGISANWAAEIGGI